MPEFDLDKKYWVNFGKKGTFKGLADEIWGISSKPEDVDDIFDYIRENSISTLAIYIHGGLVPEYFGGKSAKAFKSLVNNSTNAHPVTFIWESGPLEIYAEKFTKSLKSIILKKLFKKAVNILEPRVKVAGEGLENKGLSNITVTEMEELDNELAEQLANDIDEDNQVVTLLQDEGIETGFLTEKEYEEFNKSLAVFGAFKATASFKAKLAVAGSRCLWRFVKRRGHGLLETISEELFRIFNIAGENIDDIGQLLWSGMRDKTDYMFSPNNGRTGLNQYAGTYFLEELSRYQEGNNLDVDVFCTSAGAVAVSNMLKNNKANAYGANFRNLVLMAPANNFEDFKESFIECNDTYKSFRIFAMKDDKEKDDNFMIIYRNSLLYLISGILERKEKGNILFGRNYPDAPIIGMERHTSENAKYNRTSLEKEVCQFIRSNSNQLVLSPVEDNPPGHNCTSVSHGGFLKDPKMKESVIHILNSDVPMN